MNLVSAVKKAGRILRWIGLCNKVKYTGADGRIGKGCMVVGGDNIHIGNRISCGDRVMFQTWKEYRGKSCENNPVLIVGDDVSIMNDCQFSCANKIEIGNGVLFGPNVLVTDNYHGHDLADMDIPPIERDLDIRGPICIGDNAWIGRNVCIMGKVTIGKGAVIGANAVVTKDVPERGIAVGCPAKCVRII